MALLTKANLELAKLASQQESRTIPNAIHITPTETVVTDGHLLATLATSALTSESFPCGDRTVTDNWEPFNLDAKAALDLAKHLPKKTKQPVLSCAAISDGDETVTVVATDMEQEWKAKAKRNGAYFPNYKRVIWDPAEATFAFNLNAANLAAIASFVKNLNGSKRGVSKVPECVLRFKSAMDAVRIEAKSPEGEVFMALIMPAKHNDIAALDSTPEIIKQAKSGRGDAIVNAATRRDLLRAQLAELDAVLEGA